MARTQPAAVTIAASPNGATENGFLVSITTSSPTVWRPGNP